jgi:hypothetical protein
MEVSEVWICSGQSNMDFTVAREDRYWCGVFNEKQEVAEADYPLIRVFDTDFSPREGLQKDGAAIPQQTSIIRLTYLLPPFVLIQVIIKLQNFIIFIMNKHRILFNT